MRRQIRGWSALRFFEVAGRHLSFARAAEELCVTAAAVSHQIGELEKQLGFKVFERNSRHMTFTSEGAALFSAASDSVRMIAQTIDRIESSHRRPRLRVIGLPTITAKWLLPRLGSYMELVPEADVAIEVGQHEVDFVSSEFDVAIRFGNGDYPGMIADRLFEETVYPVCSPVLIGNKRFREPHEVLAHTLIHVDWHAENESWPEWQAWLLAAGIRTSYQTRALHFRQAPLAIEAAINGYGIMLGDSTLVADDIAAGRLMQPFDAHLKSPLLFAYHVVCPAHRANDKLVSSFRKWILEEARIFVNQH